MGSLRRGNLSGLSRRLGGQGVIAVKPLQWCLPLVQGRGAGLGNELIPWARAYLMARVLNARHLPPAFGMNARGYRRHFGTPRADWIVHRAMAASLPVVRFDEADYLAHGGADVSDAFARFAKSRGLADRSPAVVVTDGLWGGIQHVARAREFVRGTLYGSRFAAANLAELSARLQPDKLTIAMHVRLGDFTSAESDPEAYRGRFNCSLPLDWFMSIGRQLLAAFGDTAQFQLFSDGAAEQLAPLVALLRPVDTRSALPSDVSDMLAMSQADLLVCSVSSYSVWAAALSQGNYLWFAPQMHEHGDDLVSIWGHEPGQQLAGGATATALASQQALAPGHRDGRAFAVGMTEKLPSGLMEALHRRANALARRGDLVRYGVAAMSRRLR
jgi:hypothetical protein